MRRGSFDLRNDAAYFLRFRDHVSGLEFIRSSREIHERGLYVELGEYKSHIFLDVREVHDADGRLAQLNDELAGRGVDKAGTRVVGDMLAVEEGDTESVT